MYLLFGYLYLITNCSDLKNDSISETFDLKCSIGGKENYFPVKYVKILLLQSWGPNTNCSLWYIRLTGIDDFKLVKPRMDWLNVVKFSFTLS